MRMISDTGYFSTLKMAIEDLLGHSAWYDLKESSSISLWRRYLKRVIKVLQISITETVHSDEAWHEEVSELLDRCHERLDKANDFEELLSPFTATLLHLNFLQIGLIPRLARQEKITLHRNNWKLDTYRTVIHAQKTSQRASLFWSKQQREIGFRAQMDLKDEYRVSGSSLSYEDWCKQRDQDDK